MQLKCRVRKRFVDELGIRGRYNRNIEIDRNINYTPISFDAIHSVCALPEPSKNTDLFNILYTLNEGTLGYVKHECDKIRWNNHRCRRCFCPGVCYSCTIPYIYELEQVHWEDVSCHTKKQHHNYYLCVGVHTVCYFITIIKPTTIG